MFVLMQRHGDHLVVRHREPLPYHEASELLRACRLGCPSGDFVLVPATRSLRRRCAASHANALADSSPDSAAQPATILLPTPPAANQPFNKMPFVSLGTIVLDAVRVALRPSMN